LFENQQSDVIEEILLADMPPQVINDSLLDLGG
jgi:hypothetical protein